MDIEGRALSPGLGLAAILLLAASLRLWRLDYNGWGNEYYTAGVRSMMESWHNFFFNAFDPAGFISLDKPPVAFWIQVASAKLFGFTGPSILLPQVFEGLAAILLLYHLVRRRFGVPAGLLAALFLALTPISVAVDRSSNTDSCLVLILLLAAWPLICAAERGSWALLLLSMVLVGIGFNVKMAAALVVLPPFVAVYFIGAPGSHRRRLSQLLIAAVVLLGTSLSWMTAYDLTPEDRRPFVGSSQHNSMFELAIGHNAIERFVRHHRAWRGAAGATAAEGTAATDGADRGNAADARISDASAGPEQPDRGTAPRARENVPAGPLRLADPGLASQVGWLFPLATMGLAAAAWRLRPIRRRDPAFLALLLWCGWAMTCAVVYSSAGGIFHSYYMLPMAPPLCALAGIGLVNLLWFNRRGGWCGYLLPLGLLLTGFWQAYIEYFYLGTQGSDASPDWWLWLYFALLGGTAFGVSFLILARAPAVSERTARVFAAGALSIGVAALLATPAAWALSVVLARGHVAFPVADLRLLMPGGELAGRRGRDAIADSAAVQKLIAYLVANRHDERYVLATLNARQAAPIIIRTGAAVMAVGGYGGTDVAITPEKFARLVADGQIRFMLIGEPGRLRPAPRGGARQAALVGWVREMGRPVAPTLWRTAGMAAAPDAAGFLDGSARPARRQGNRVDLFDLRTQTP